MQSPKIFCIGFHKTGTTSLAAALEQLGYSVTGPNGVLNPNLRDEVYDMAFALVEQYDAFVNNPWPLLYRELDQKYPGSKFILTVRPTESWIGSVVNHFGAEQTPMRELIYGTGLGFPEGNEELYKARYEQHNNEALAYFKYRPDDFLVLRLTEGDGWEKLCPFLGRPVPTTEFPYINTSSDIEKIKIFRGRAGRGLQ